MTFGSHLQGGQWTATNKGVQHFMNQVNLRMPGDVEPITDEVAKTYFERQDPSWDIFDKIAELRNRDRTYTGSSWTGRSVLVDVGRNDFVDLRHELENRKKDVCFMCNAPLDPMEVDDRVATSCVHQSEHLPCLQGFLDLRDTYGLGAVNDVCAAPKCKRGRHRPGAPRFCTNECLYTKVGYKPRSDDLITTDK